MFRKIFNMMCLAMTGLSVAAMDGKDLDFSGEDLENLAIFGNAGGEIPCGQLRDHDYYRQELQKLEESTRRIHEEVDRILEEFRRNMEAYRKHTRGTEAITTSDTGIPRKAGQEADTNQFNKELNRTEKEPMGFVEQGIAARNENIGPRKIDGWELQDVEGKGNCFYDAAVHQMKLIKYSFLGIASKEVLLGDALRLHIQGEDLKDEEWADDKIFNQFVKKTDDIILAIVDFSDCRYEKTWRWLCLLLC